MDIDPINTPQAKEEKKDKLGNIKFVSGLILVLVGVQLLLSILLSLGVKLFSIFHMNATVLYVSLILTEIFALGYSITSVVAEVARVHFEMLMGEQHRTVMNQTSIITQNSYILDRLGEISSKLDGTVITSFSGKDSSHVN